MKFDKLVRRDSVLKRLDGYQLVCMTIESPHYDSQRSYLVTEPTCTPDLSHISFSMFYTQISLVSALLDDPSGFYQQLDTVAKDTWDCYLPNPVFQLSSFTANDQDYTLAVVSDRYLTYNMLFSKETFNLPWVFTDKLIKSKREIKLVCDLLFNYHLLGRYTSVNLIAKGIDCELTYPTPLGVSPKKFVQLPVQFSIPDSENGVSCKFDLTELPMSISIKYDPISMQSWAKDKEFPKATYTLHYKHYDVAIKVQLVLNTDN